MYHFCTRPVVRGMEMDAMRPLKICPHPPGICEISKANMLISPLNNLLHATASTGACVELTCLEKTRFEKYLGLIPGEGKICRNSQGAALTTHPRLAPRPKKNRAKRLFPLWIFTVCCRINFTLCWFVKCYYVI